MTTFAVTRRIPATARVGLPGDGKHVQKLELGRLESSTDHAGKGFVNFVAEKAVLSVQRPPSTSRGRVRPGIDPPGSLQLQRLLLAGNKFAVTGLTPEVIAHLLASEPLGTLCNQSCALILLSKMKELKRGFDEIRKDGLRAIQ